MRIVVSGTHASGKSTLIADFVSAHPEYRVLPDPFEWLDESDEPDVAAFVRQLQVAARRLMRLAPGDDVIAERGPLDFLAYLDALGAAGPVRAAAETARVAMDHVDLLVVLPLTAADDIRVPDDEDPQLRAAMDDALREFVDDEDLTGGARVVEISGTPERRLRLLEDAIA